MENKISLPKWSNNMGIDGRGQWEQKTKNINFTKILLVNYSN